MKKISRNIIDYRFMLSITIVAKLVISKCSPVTGLEWPRGFQKVNVPKFSDNGTGRW